MAAIWSPEGKVKAERRLWVAVLEAQRDLGIAAPDGAVEAYRSVIDQVHLDSIRQRERVTRHDVKARIEEFCALAGHEHIHKGMTSRDLTENIEQLQVRDSLRLVRDKLVGVVCALGRRAGAHAEVVMVGRSHNVAAQATTLGKRFANCGEEALAALERVDGLLGRYRLRGLKGPVGTRQDQLDLFGGDAGKVAELDERVAVGLGFAATMDSVGQVYPRSLDYDVVTALVQVSSAPANLARTSGSWPVTGWFLRDSRPGRWARRPCPASATPAPASASAGSPRWCRAMPTWSPRWWATSGTRAM